MYNIQQYEIRRLKLQQIIDEILNALRYNNMLQQMSHIEREDIIKFICEEYGDLMQENDDYSLKEENEDLRRCLKNIAYELGRVDF